MTKTCANCAHSTSKDPKCGLCCGPTAKQTRWTQHEASNPSSSTQPQPVQRGPEWYARWIRNNYQDHPNIATLCEELTKAAHGIKGAPCR